MCLASRCCDFTQHMDCINHGIVEDSGQVIMHALARLRAVEMMNNQLWES
jgi:hypothetical protein